MIRATSPKTLHPHWIEMDVLVDGPTCFARLVNDSLESTLQQRPFPTGFAVKPDRIGDIQPSDRLAQVQPRRGYLQMIVIRHQRVGLHPRAKALDNTPQQQFKLSIVSFRTK